MLADRRRIERFTLDGRVVPDPAQAFGPFHTAAS
jgi:hypothetical protein